jgi:hypothetical protein
MTDQALSRNDALVQRLDLVAKVSEVTAEVLRLQQALAGAEMDALRCELAIGRNGNSDALVRELHEAQHSIETINAAWANCDTQITLLDDQIAKLDEILDARNQK